VSRTRKGSKGPGWEPWSNNLDKQEQKADYVESSEGEEVSRIKEAISELSKVVDSAALNPRWTPTFYAVLAALGAAYDVERSHVYGHSSFADLANDTLGIALTALADEVLT
jgi:hypothetical protein